MYCDIDIVVLKSLHNLTEQMEPNKFYVMAEGSMTALDYNAAFSKEKQLTFTENDTGYSAGKFIITSQKIRDIIFNEIQTPIFIAILFFLFQIPFINQLLKRFAFLSIYNLDGNFNFKGLLLKSIIFGSVYYVIMKSVNFISEF